MAEKLTIAINGDVRDYKRKLGEVEDSTRGLSDKLKTLAKGAAVAFTGLSAGVALAVNEARKIETITTQFEVLTGSADEASKIVKDLQEFAATTPFQFEGIAKASQQLLGFGFAADQLPEKLQQIGDVASASGTPINELSLIFGQVSAAGKLTGERLLQLQERAIPIGPALAKTMGVAEESVRDLVSAGLVSFSTFEKAFSSLSQEGEFAFQGMIKQSKTLDGVLSTVGDNISLFAAGVGKEMLPVVKEMANQLLVFIQNLRKSNTFINLIKDTISFTSRIVLSTAEAFETLGTRIGAIMATVSEAVSAALNLEFKRAVEVFKTNNEQFRNDVLEIEKSYADKQKAIDAALYSEKEKIQKESQQNEVDNIKQQGAKKIEAQEQINQQELDKIQEFVQKKKEKEQEGTIAISEELQNRIDTISEKIPEKTETELELLQQEIDKKAEQDTIAKAQELERNGKHAEAMAMIEELKNSRIIASNKKRLQQEKQIQEANLKATSNFLQAGINLAKQGSQEQKVLQTAAATVSTYSAATKALSSPPGPPFTIPLAASVVALGLSNIARINAVKFRDGGMYSGGIPGVDSIPAVVQRGEITAPTKSFDEVVEGTARMRGFERVEDEGGGFGESVVRFVLEPAGDFVGMIEQQIVERRMQGRSII